MARFKCFITYLIVCLLALGWSVPISAQTGSWDLIEWPRNTKLGIEVGWGIPYGSVLGDAGEIDGVWFLHPRWGTSLRSRVSHSWRWGIVGWYGMIKDQEGGAWAFGPEIGLLLGSKQKVQFVEFDDYGGELGKHSVEAHAVHVPICAQLTFFSEEISKILELKVGYELSIIYALRYQRFPRGVLWPHEKDHATWKANRTIFSGSLIFGGTVYFLRGCYLTMSFKAPIEALAKLKQSHKRERSSVGNSRLFYGAWARCTSLIEFSLGIDIVDSFLEDF